MLPIWNADLDSELTDLVFDSNLSPHEISLHFKMTESFIRNRIKELGLQWVQRRKGAKSRGQAALTQMLRKLLPGEEVRVEEPVGERLFLDIYCPKYNLAIEYHGRQHFEYNGHFHGDIEGFHDSQRRDDRKIEICQDLGIVLVSFRYNDDLSETKVVERILDAIRQAPPITNTHKESRLKGDPHYESWKRAKREYNRELYRRMRAGQ